MAVAEDLRGDLLAFNPTSGDAERVRVLAGGKAIHGFDGPSLATPLGSHVTRQSTPPSTDWLGVPTAQRALVGGASRG